jgi:hypothetical protein
MQNKSQFIFIEKHSIFFGVFDFFRNFAAIMKKVTIYIFFTFLLLATGAARVRAEEKLPEKLLNLTNEAYRFYSQRETDEYFETVKKVKDATEFSQYQETYYRACSYEAIYMFEYVDRTKGVQLAHDIYHHAKADDMHGKTLFVYTDGINEAENANKEQFGDARLQALLKRDLGDARQTSETIHRAVEEFVGGAEPSDDLTKMCIKMK